MACALVEKIVVRANTLSSSPTMYSPSLASGVFTVFFFVTGLALGCCSARKCCSLGLRFNATFCFCGFGSLVCNHFAVTPVHARNENRDGTESKRHDSPRLSRIRRQRHRHHHLVYGYPQDHDQQRAQRHL